MPSTQPLLGTLHLYSSTLFSLLMGNTPNLLVFDNSVWDMDIMTLCEWTIQFRTHIILLLFGSSLKDIKFYSCNVTKL
jgi:hypothetical protein